MNSTDDYRYMILQSINKNDLFIDDYHKMEVLNTLRLFLDKYDFEYFTKNYNLSKKEYNKYFKPFTKVMKPQKHKYAKKHFDIESVQTLLNTLGLDD